MLTVSEVAERLRLRPKTIYERIAAGDIHAFRLGEKPGARLRIPAAELDHLLRDPAIEAQLAQLRAELRKAAP